MQPQTSDYIPSIDRSLVELIQLRAFEVNSNSSGAAGVLAAWRETPVYTDRERAALAWTEAVASIARQQPTDRINAEARIRTLALECLQQFTEEELVHLTRAIVAVSGWSRFLDWFDGAPENYAPPQSSVTAKDFLQRGENTQ